MEHIQTLDDLMDNLLYKTLMAFEVDIRQYGNMDLDEHVLRSIR